MHFVIAMREVARLSHFLLSGCSQVKKEINDNTLGESLPVVSASLLAQTLGPGPVLHQYNQDDQL